MTTYLYDWKNEPSLSETVPTSLSAPGTLSFKFGNTNIMGDNLIGDFTPDLSLPLVTPKITIDFKNSKIDYQINSGMSDQKSNQYSAFKPSPVFTIFKDDFDSGLHDAITTSGIYKLTDNYENLEWKLKNAMRNTDSNRNILSDERNKLINDLKSQMKKVKDDENKINNLHTMNIVLIVTSCVLLIALIISLFNRGKKK